MLWNSQNFHLNPQQDLLFNKLGNEIESRVYQSKMI